MQRTKIKLFLAACSFSLISSSSYAFDIFNSDAKTCNELLAEGKDLNIALRYCERAANNGDKDIQVKLGELKLAEKNYTQAKYWFEKAANYQQPTSLYYIGYLQEKGLGEAVDKKSAAFYYQQACKHDYLKACQRLELLKEEQLAKEKQQINMQQEQENQLNKLKVQNKQLAIQQKQATEQSRLELERAKIELAQAQAEAQKAKAEAEKAKAEAQQAQQQAANNSQNNANSSNYSSNYSTNNYSTSNSQAPDLSQYNFKEGLAKFERNGLWGYIDAQGTEVISPRFAYAANFYQGRAAVKNSNDKWGFIDRNGYYVVMPQYACVGRFSEGLAGVYVNGWVSDNSCVGGKWGFINVQGQMVIPAILDEAQAFSKGKAKITYKGRTGFINKNGNWVD